MRLQLTYSSHCNYGDNLQNAIVWNSFYNRTGRHFAAAGKRRLLDYCTYLWLKGSVTRIAISGLAKVTILSDYHAAGGSLANYEPVGVICPIKRS